jgi:hypothetical protein
MAFFAKKMELIAEVKIKSFPEKNNGKSCRKKRPPC